MNFTETIVGELTVMQADNLIGSERLSHAFTTRFGGISQGIFKSLNLGVNRGDEKTHVYQNYERLCSILGTVPSKFVFSAQVHEDEVKPVSGMDSKGDIFARMKYEADGLITNERDLPLIIFIADCIPILLYSPDVQAIGAVHAGWRGTVKNIAGKAVKKMCDVYGSRPENIIAAIGPGIGRCCFVTGPEVPEAVLRLDIKDPRSYVEMITGRQHVDLKGINHALLLAEGLMPENIAISDECTMCKSEKYWSHRATKGQRGAQAAVIMLTSTSENLLSTQLLTAETCGNE